MYRLFGKRLVDIVVSLGAIVVLSPVLIACGIGARCASEGPAIFRQTRVGRSGETFVFFKFRSMPVDTANVASDQIGEITLTSFGRFLRRTNLDELPQLFNILIGDMSLVGPRPSLPTQRELLDLRRTNGAIECRPGLTGLAQVSSFDGMSVERKAALDGAYAARISMVGDAAIILKTFAYLAKPPPKY